jgi:hypothetical protein
VDRTKSRHTFSQYLGLPPVWIAICGSIQTRLEAFCFGNMATFYLPYFLRDSSGSFVWAGGGSCITSVFFPSRAIGLRSCRFDGGTTSFLRLGGSGITKSLETSEKAVRLCLCVWEEWRTRTRLSTPPPHTPSFGTAPIYNAPPCQVLRPPRCRCYRRPELHNVGLGTAAPGTQPPPKISVF